jgi:hypothetical protein
MFFLRKKECKDREENGVGDFVRKIICVLGTPLKKTDDDVALTDGVYLLSFIGAESSV